MGEAHQAGSRKPLWQFDDVDGTDDDDDGDDDGGGDDGGGGDDDDDIDSGDDDEAARDAGANVLFISANTITKKFKMKNLNAK